MITLIPSTSLAHMNGFCASNPEAEPQEPCQGGEALTSFWPRRSNPIRRRVDLPLSAIPVCFTSSPSRPLPLLPQPPWHASSPPPLPLLFHSIFTLYLPSSLSFRLFWSRPLVFLTSAILLVLCPPRPAPPSLTSYGLICLRTSGSSLPLLHSYLLSFFVSSKPFNSLKFVAVITSKRTLSEFMPQVLRILCVERNSFRS